MKPELFLYIAGTGLTLTAAAGVWMYLGTKKEGPAVTSPPLTEGGVERQHLSELSELWTEKVLTLHKASALWVDQTEKGKPAEFPRPVLINEELVQFWVQIVEPRKTMTKGRKTAIAALLKKLDQEGNCPSVVRNTKHPDVENKYDDDTFRLLSTIPLWKHTIEVARAMATRVGSETLVGDAVITSLGHDLGKIPDYHSRGYSTGDHPLISAIVVNSISEFKNLPNAQELEQIIRSHHALEPANPLAGLLKTCDRIVRNQEISGKLQTAVEVDRQLAAQQSAAASPDIQPEQQTQQPEKPVIVAHADLPQAPTEKTEQTDHPLEVIETSKGASHVPQRKELPWFMPDNLLNELKQWINVVAQGKWGAISMPDGLVYVNQDLLWALLKETVSPEIKPSLIAADADESERRSILHSVVWQLSEQRHAIAADMLNPNYYMIPVVIINGSNKQIKGQPMLVPFRSEAFGMLPSDLEALKGPNIRRMVKIVRPRTSNDTDGGGQSELP